MSPASDRGHTESPARLLLPNLGAEEGADWFAVANHAPVLVAARLWALLFAGRDSIRFPREETDDAEIVCDSLWPAALGDVPTSPAFPWLSSGRVHAWLNTEAAAAYAQKRFEAPLVGLPPSLAWELSDKARTAELASELDLTPAALSPLVEPITPGECLDADALLTRLESKLAAWPSWTERRFTLKPRFGTSGRGRVGGMNTVDTPAVRSALPRLAKRGGALFEPWLNRQTDLSVSLLVPQPGSSASLPTILGSLEMLTSPSGLYRGHCGEVDNRGRVFSGQPEDESLRGDAGMIASALQEKGFFGACGVDAFTYQEGDRSRLRSAVELNPRITMGIVVLGLIRRALPLVRQTLDLSPGSRRGVLMTSFSKKDEKQRDALLASLEASEARTLSIPLASPVPTDSSVRRPVEEEADTSSPMLFFAEDLESLRAAYREATGC